MKLTKNTNRVRIIFHELNVNEVWAKQPSGWWVHEENKNTASGAALQSVLKYVDSLGYQIFDESIDEDEFMGFITEHDSLDCDLDDEEE